MLHLNRQPVPEDAQGWGRVLVFVDGNNSIQVHPTVINLNEENNYFQPLYIQGEGKWTISGVIEEFIQLESSSGQREGIGNARIDITKTPTLIAQGGYSCHFLLTLANAEGTTMTVQVYITVNVPLVVHDKRNGETLEINLNVANNYTRTLTIIRDREWTLENVDTSKINASPTSGNGADLQDFISTLTVTKSPSLTPALTVTNTTTTFQVVSLFQRVNIIVNITMPAVTITGEFVNPRPGEAGATGTGNLYLYL
jgi:hypothetical protein